MSGLLGQKQFSTDRIAFYTTVGQLFCGPQFPNSTTSSYHCSLMHWKEGFQIEPEGAITYATCSVRHKVFYLAWEQMDLGCQVFQDHLPIGLQMKTGGLRLYLLVLDQLCECFIVSLKL